MKPFLKSLLMPLLSLAACAATAQTLRVGLAEDPDGDTDVDLADMAAFQLGFTGPHP